MNNTVYFTGLDKTTITGFTIESINFTKLRQANNVTIYYNNAQNFKRNVVDEETGELTGISFIGIEDNQCFTDFKMGAAFIKGQPVFYESLSLFVRGRGENNLIPSNIAFYKRNLKQVTEWLYDYYGIKIDVTEAKFQTLEYNATILIKEEFAEYQRLLNTLVKLAPKTLRDATTHYKNREYTGNVIKNKSISYKFYDKTKQLSQKYEMELHERWLRVELAITNENKNSKRIFEQHLGTCKISEVTDRMLAKMFVTLFNRDFIKPLKDFINKSYKDTLKAVKAAKMAHKKNYLVYAINDLMKQEIDSSMPTCFDYEYFKQAVESVEKGNSNRAKLIKTAEKHIPSKWIQQLDKAEMLIDIIEEIERRANTKLVAPNMSNYNPVHNYKIKIK